MATASETAQHGHSRHIAASAETDQDVPVLVLALSTVKALRALIGLKLIPLGLVVGQDRLLAALNAKGPIGVSGLAEELNVRPATVSKMMDRMVAHGLAVRASDHFDKRRTEIQLTDVGRTICEKLEKLNALVEGELRSNLTDDSVRQMTEGLELLNQAVSRCLKRLR